MPLTIFFDSQCPLCVDEMRRLKQRDHKQDIHLVDLYDEAALEHYPNIDAQHASRILHAITDDGTLLLGLDVTHKAWQLVGLGYLTAPLRWPLIKPIADYCYLGFAKHRYTISRWLTGKTRCERCRLP